MGKFHVSFGLAGWMRRGRCRAALALLVACVAIAAAAQAPDAMRRQAMALEQKSQNPEAETAWRAVLGTHPSSAEAYAHLGLLEARQEHYLAAVPLYRKALTLNPALPGLRLNLGLALFKAGELKQALLQFERLLAGKGLTAEQTQRLTILAAMAHYGLGEYAAATPLLKAAAARDPENLQLRLALAHSCLWSKQYQCVLDTYHAMLTLNAESAEVDMLAGEAEDAMKDYDGAIRQFRAAVKANPAEPDAHFGLGYILWTQRQYPEAASEFQTELAGNPHHAQALAYLGDTEMQLNQPALSLPLLEKAVGVDSGLELAHLDLGIQYADAGRNDEALREMKMAARLAPDDVNVHWRLGQLYRTLGNKEEAKAEFARANSLHRATDNALLDRMRSSNAPNGGNQPAASER